MFDSCPTVPFRKLGAVAALTFGLTATLVQQTPAQIPMPCHPMPTREEVAPEKLPPPEKLTGIGNAHIKITATPEAQIWFDQGLNLLHDFWDYESVRAFEQAIRVDPNCAMCYWGVYRAELFTHRSAKYYGRQALAKAVALKKQVSEPERLYIEAAEKSDKKKNSDATIKVYRKLVKKSPADLQARIFLAESVGDGYDDNGQPNRGQKEELALLQSVLKDDPENSAANHYWIHAVEASQHPEQAVHSAEILGRLAPTSGHMVHMPGHIFYRTGDYTRAKESFAASILADEHYMQSQHVDVDDDWNYVHNLMYAIGKSGGFGPLVVFDQICDGVHEVGDVVPIVVDVDVLGLHIVLVGEDGGGEGFFGASVITSAIENVAGHVDHVAGSGGEAAKDFGAVDGLLGMLAGFDGVNPVVIGGGVFGIVF